MAAQREVRARGATGHVEGRDPIDRAARELVWFFRESSAACGDRGFDPESAGGGSGASASMAPAGYTEEQLTSARRRSEVLAILRQLPPRYVAVLQVAYEPREWPPELRIAFGDLVGVVIRVDAANALDQVRESDPGAQPAPDALARSRDRLRSTAAKKGRGTLSRLLSVANGLVDEALSAFVTARQLHQADQRPGGRR